MSKDREFQQHHTPMTTSRETGWRPLPHINEGIETAAPAQPAVPGSEELIIIPDLPESGDSGWPSVARSVGDPSADTSKQRSSSAGSRWRALCSWRILRSLAVILSLIGILFFAVAFVVDIVRGQMEIILLVPALIAIVLSVLGLKRIWAGGTARKAKDKDTIRGTVRAFNARIEYTLYSHSPQTVWTFRIERYQGGEQLPPVPVEMRGHSFSGFISEGDTVEIEADSREGTLVKAKRVYNVTAGTEVKVCRWLPPLTA